MFQKEILSFYSPIIKKYKSLFILMGISGIISGLSSVGMPILLKIETDQLVEQKSLEMFEKSFGAFEVFIIILGIILFVNIIETLLSSINSIFSRSKEDLLKNEIQFALFQKMKDMEIGRAMSTRYKYISQIIDSNFPSISETIINIPKNIIQFIIQLVGMVAIYAYFDIRLLFVVIFSAIIGYGIQMIARKIAQKYEIDWKFSLGRQVRKYSNLFLNQFSNLAISGGLLSTLKNYSFLLGEENKHSIKRNFNELIWNINDLINTSLRDIVLKGIVGYGVFIGTNSVGMVVLVVASMGTLGELISQIFRLRTNYKNFLFEQESVLLMLKICTPIGNEIFSDKVEKIEFKKVGFSYPNLAKYEKEYIEIVQKNIIGKELGDDWLDQQIKGLIETIEEESKIPFPQIFSQINLNFEKGKVYGVVGKNGAGKTTLMYLLSGFYREYSGEILFNGRSTKDFNTESFLNKVAFLTQTPFMLDWNSTVRENLFLGVDENVGEEKAWKYLEQFGLAKKIKKHKKGLDAEIGNDIGLSGGEEQIITFIRLLLQDRDIIIMDEGTNQLDAENEVGVMSALLENKENKIIIFITHRMSTISKVDEIYCLEDGIITANGNHTKLLKSRGNAYERFYKAQVLHEG